MALKTINDLTALTTPASTDLIGVWSVSAGRMRKSTLAQVVTQAGVAAIKSTTNTFAAPQTITLPSSAGAVTTLVLSSFDNGADIGARLSIGENSNGSTPAAGSINLRTMGAASRYIWHDTTGLLRTHTAAVTNATDTAGTVVGAQSSHVDFKDVAGAPVDDATALAHLVTAAAAVARFTYKSGAYGSQQFSGLVLNGPTLHRYGQDADETHPAGKSLNVINAIGDMLLAMREVERRLTALEA